MRRLILFAFAAALCFATDPTIGGERYEQKGPQIAVPGYGLAYMLWPSWTVTVACSSVDSTCTSADYTPDGTEVFSVSDTGLTATGLATKPYGSSFWRPRYKAVNIVGATFKLAMLSGGTFAETSYVKTAGTPSTSVPACPDGSWPRMPGDGQTTGLFFSGNGSTVQGRFQATTVGGVITSTAMIDGGGNFSSMPATGTVKCNSVRGGAMTTYTVTFSGGALGTSAPITGSGNATLVIISGGHGLGTIWLKDVAGKNWPSGTKMTYWAMNDSGSFAYKLGGVPASGSMGLGGLHGIEVLIPASASPGTITAGWTFCNDSAGTIGCADITKAITVTALPAYTFVAPTPVALPSAFTSSSPVACFTSPTSGVVSVGTDCRFKTLLTSTAENGYGHWCPLRQAAAPNNPDYTLELASPASVMVWSIQGNAEFRAGWYYDGAKIYHKIAQFTGDYTWENCSLAYLSRYTQMGPGVPNVRPGVMNPNATLLPGNRATYNTSGDITTPQFSLAPFTATAPERTFAPGMAIGVATFNNGNYITGPTPNHWNAQMIPPIYDASTNVGNWPNLTAGDSTTSYAATVYDVAQVARYVAYQVDSKVEMGRNLGLAYRDGSGNLTRFGLAAQIARESLWSYVLQFYNPAISGPYDNGPTGDQTWMIGGLMTEALIGSYELWRDPMDLYTLKLVLDLMYNTYDPVTHLLPQNSAPEGLGCTGFAWWRPGSGWYAAAPAEFCSDDGSYTDYQPLNGMLAAGYAWWWKNFGGSNSTYATFADTLAIDGLLVDTTFGWRFAPKASNEEYGRYGFDYYRWRQNR